jgi:dTDP-glucose 4,6-dehydratase
MKPQQKILVTGSEGVVGAKLLDLLRGRGSECFGVDLSHKDGEAGWEMKMSMAPPNYARCDVANFRQLERVFDAYGPFDLVYHAAAEFGRWNGEDFYEQVWTTNAIGTKNMIRLQEKRKVLVLFCGQLFCPCCLLCARFSPPYLPPSCVGYFFQFRMVFFSSSEVYGDYDGVMEESVMDMVEIKQLNDYALSKWVNEQQIRNSHTMYKTETVIVRLFNTYGPGEWYHPYRSVACKFCYHALKGIPIVVHKGHLRSSMFLADCCNTLANIAQNFVPGAVYNIGDKNNHSMEHLAEVIWKETGADPSLITYQDVEILTTVAKRATTARAEADLGHVTPTPLEEGIRQTIAWMRQVYMENK